MHIKHLTSDNVLFCDRTEKQHVIREILQHLESRGLIGNTMRYYAQIIHRESLENTGIGNGFAIPHARTETVDRLIMAFCSLREPIEYESFDHNPVRFLLLSIFPAHYSTTYLYYVSMFANIFSVQNNIDMFSRCEEPDTLYSLLIDLSQKYYNGISDPCDAVIDFNANLAGVPGADLELLVRLDRLYNIRQKNDDEDLSRRIGKLEKLIDKRSLTYYKRMKDRCKNPFAFVEKNACSGCNMNIPPTELNRRSSIMLCSNCGRFLLYL
ncbi:MAG: PTS sugar transporter subunit IIA [Spirochaetota bacterium]